ncbi:MAG: translational GTPase TypA [Christensenellaceae bacterium]|jgi:GTP-binding protein|nr:translational GTPase TypA [Christensenellaceae bacterium]
MIQLKIMQNNMIRNVAVIAHVDHGKTSLVNEFLKQTGTFRENQFVADRLMDSNALEKERGITILAKNCSVNHKGIKINIVDTPGHADFGGEVERSLKMVDGVLLIIDAYEGPMPQTRFVLEKALQLNHKVIVVINKIDRPDARIAEVQDEVLGLLMDLDATEEQLDSPFVCVSARMGTNIVELLDKIIAYIPAPECDGAGTFQMLVGATEHNEYVGKIAVGKVTSGEAAVNGQVVRVNYHDTKMKETFKITQLFQFIGMNKVALEKTQMGDIVCISGCADISVGDTVSAVSNPVALPFIKISEPSVEMTFMVNDSPFAGKEGKFVTSRHLRERLYKEADKDLSLKVSDTDSTEKFRVCGRGEMHLSILIENMRREGFEFAVSQPKVMFKRDENGKVLEPIDKAVIDVPEINMGSVMERMGSRRGELLQMTPHGSRMKLEFLVPSRGLFGYKSELLTDTKGEGIINTVGGGYVPYKGDIMRRKVGSLIAFETGESNAYGLYNAQERGSLFIGAGVQVYMGMLVGSNPAGDDLPVNVCKKKALSNMRSTSSDEALRLVPPIQFTLEECLEFIGEDELVEVTPKNVRMRKMELDHSKRLRARGKTSS